ncbi:MAG TPA: pyridoxal-phosphate dependent enzyme [Anaerolineaceae bacterium]
MNHREILTQAAGRIRGLVNLTPLTYDSQYGIYLKWENRQLTGSFKLRGALNKVLSLDGAQRERGLVTASAGNHGQGVALAAHRVGAKVTVFASDHAVPAKLDAMRSLGAEVRLVPGGYALAEQTALQFAAESGMTWISPYNDLQVIAGQATVGLEILEQYNPFTAHAIIVPAGGGGLVTGTGMAMDGRCKVIGVSSQASPYLHELFYRGSQDHVVESESLADGLAGAVEPGAVTINLAKEWVDEFILVSEESIADAIGFAWFRYGERIEGSAATTLAAILSEKISERPAVLIISGGNIQPALHASLAQRWQDARGGAKPA